MTKLQPVQAFLPSEVQTVTPILARVPFVITQITGSPGFVTPDAPYV